MKTIETMKQDIVKRAFDKFMHQNPPPLNDITVSAAFAVDEVFKFLSEIGIDGAKIYWVHDSGEEAIEDAYFPENFKDKSEWTRTIEHAPIAAQILQLKDTVSVQSGMLSESRKQVQQLESELKQARQFIEAECKRCDENEAENAQLKRENEELKAPKLAFYMMRSQGFGKTSTAIRDMLLRLTEGSTIKITCPDVEKLESQLKEAVEVIEKLLNKTEIYQSIYQDDKELKKYRIEAQSFLTKLKGCENE